MTSNVLEEFRAIDADPAEERPFGELTPPALPPREPQQLPPHRTARRVVAAATGIAAATAAVLVSGLPFGSEPGGNSEIPAALLTASLASENSAADGVRYTRTRTGGLMATGAPGAMYSPRMPVVIDSWVRPDGSGRVRRTYLPAKWPGPRDKRVAERLGDKRSLAQAKGRRLPDNFDKKLSAEELAKEVDLPGLPAPDSLSTDPEKLREQLTDSDVVRDSGQPLDEALFRAAGGLVLAPNIDGDVRSAGYKLIGSIPGIEIDRTARDPLGRRATAVTLSEQRRVGSASTLYFDPSTGQALAGVQRLKHRQKFMDSRLLGSTVVVRTKTFDRVPPVPGG